MFLLIYFPIGASAETAPPVPGGLELKIDRIIKGEDKKTINKETELEKVFPNLFAEETKEKINVMEEEKAKTLEELEESLFRMRSDKNLTLQNIKQSLFTENYTAVATSTSNMVEDEENNKVFGDILLIFFAFIGCLLAGGLYILMKKSFD